MARIRPRHYSAVRKCIFFPAKNYPCVKSRSEMSGDEDGIREMRHPQLGMNPQRCEFPKQECRQRHRATRHPTKPINALMSGTRND